jgi:hypothetical protein
LIDDFGRLPFAICALPFALLFLRSADLFFKVCGFSYRPAEGPRTYKTGPR